MGVIFRKKMLFVLVFSLFLLLSPFSLSIKNTVVGKINISVSTITYTALAIESVPPPPNPLSAAFSFSADLRDGLGNLFFGKDSCIANLGACIIVGFGNALVFLSSIILALAGMLLDAMIALSLQTSTYLAPFVNTGWTTIRDLANLTFIFTLLYIAISTILQLNSFDTKKALSKLIIAALLINFSLFTTRVVIDGSNILAEMFYSSIKNTPDARGIKIAGIEIKSISGGMVGAFEPQKILGVKNFDALYTDTKNPWSSVGTLFSTFMLATAVNLIAAWAFFVVSFLFIARIAMLWGLMITAPLPFVAMILDKTKKHAITWWNTLFSQAFLAPVFLFFIYLIIQLVNSPIIGDLKNEANLSVGSGNSTGNAPIFLSVILSFSLIIVTLIKATEITKKMSGEAGAMITGFGMKAAGLLAGGGVGMVGRRLIGGGMAKYLNKEVSPGVTKRTQLAEGGFMSRMALGGMRGAERASWNVSNLPGASKLGMAGQGGKGGYAAMQKAAAADYRKKAASFETDAEREAFARSMTGAGGLMGRVWRGSSSKTAEKASAGIIDAAQRRKQDEAQLKLLQKEVHAAAGITDSMNIDQRVQASGAYAKTLENNIQIAESELAVAIAKGNSFDIANWSHQLGDHKAAIKKLEKLAKLGANVDRRNEHAAASSGGTHKGP